MTKKKNYTSIICALAMVGISYLISKRKNTTSTTTTTTTTTDNSEKQVDASVLNYGVKTTKVTPFSKFQ